MALFYLLTDPNISAASFYYEMFSSCFFVKQINHGGLLGTRITHLMQVFFISSERWELVHMLMIQ